jgi:uncharacterized protein (TIGR03066 family)
MQRFISGLAVLTFALVAIHVDAGDEKENEKVQEKELLGKWISQDGGKHPVIFEKDGGIKYGWKEVKGEWTMAAGKYTIDATGKITGQLQQGGVTFRPWFRLKDGMLEGPRGPRPVVIWKKEPSKDNVEPRQ